MAGTLTLSTLSDGSTSTSATNVINGSAKAWVSFAGTSTPTIRGSYNVSSVSYTSSGDFTVNFTNAFANANYSCLVTGSNGGFQGLVGGIRDASAVPTTSAVRLFFVDSTFASSNPSYGMVAVFNS